MVREWVEKKLNDSNTVNPGYRMALQDVLDRMDEESTQAVVAEVDDEGALLVDGDPVGRLFGDGTPLYVAPGKKVRLEVLR